MIEKAMKFATRAHEGQFRKGTQRPYIVHPVEVSEIVAEMTDDEDVICAAVLHDTIEDCEGVSQRLLAQEFSEKVAYIVAAPWEVQMVGLADKLSNMRDIDRDYPVAGERLWERFRMKDKAVIGWYYKGVRDALADAFKDEKLYQEYCGLVEKYFGR